MRKCITCRIHKASFGFKHCICCRVAALNPSTDEETVRERALIGALIGKVWIDGEGYVDPDDPRAAPDGSVAWFRQPVIDEPEEAGASAAQESWEE